MATRNEHPFCSWARHTATSTAVHRGLARPTTATASLADGWRAALFEGFLTFFFLYFFFPPPLASFCLLGFPTCGGLIRRWICSTAVLFARSSSFLPPFQPAFDALLPSDPPPSWPLSFSLSLDSLRGWWSAVPDQPRERSEQHGGHLRGNLARGRRERSTVSPHPLLRERGVPPQG